MYSPTDFMVGCYSEGACVLLYWMLQGFYSSSSGLTIPTELAEAIDMKPVLNIDTIPIYSFPMNWCHIFVGSYTDTLHVMRVDTTNTHMRLQVKGSTIKSRVEQYMPIRKRYHRVSYRGEHLTSTREYSVVDHGLVVLCGNARGCTRPSFVQHFTTLHEKFNPLLVIILEARILSHYSKNWLVRDLPGQYEVEHCGPERRLGGVLMLWKPTVLSANFFYTSNAPNGMVFDVVFLAKPPLGYTALRHQPLVELNNDPCSSDEEADPNSFFFNSGLAFDGSNHHLGMGKDL